MIGLMIAVYFIFRGTRYMVKSSYYYLIIDTLKVIPVEVIDIRQGRYKYGRYHYHYAYQYDWHSQKKYYKTSGTQFKQIGDIDYLYLDPRFGIVFEDEYTQDKDAFCGVILLLTGLGYVLSYIL